MRKIEYIIICLLLCLLDFLKKLFVTLQVAWRGIGDRQLRGQKRERIIGDVTENGEEKKRDEDSPENAVPVHDGGFP